MIFAHRPIASASALALLAVLLGACGDDDAPPTGPQNEVLRPSGELMPFDLSAVVPIDSVRALDPGTLLYLRTEFARGELADLEMTFVQVVDDFLAPMPVLMVEASDPVLIQLGGIAKGMSGSPVFTEQGTLGAIAYGFGSQDSPPYYFFATPIEWVIGSRGTSPPAAKAAATWDGTRITPLEVPLVSTGPEGRLGSSGGGSSAWDQALSAGLTQERQAGFEAGRPLAVGLLLGEITGGSIGTISYVDGDRIYGFGHPMFGIGPVQLPIIEAKVLGEISNLDAPYKFATLNPTVRGILTEDRLPAVRGVLDQEPELVPITGQYTFPSGSELELTHHMPADAGLGPGFQIDLVSSAAFRPLGNRVDDEPGHSVRLRTNISFSGTDSVLARTRLYAGPEGRLFELINTASSDLGTALTTLMWRDDYALQIRNAEVHVEMIPEPRFAKVMEVSADTVVFLGSTLSITASLRVGRLTDREVELELAIPDTIPPGHYQLEVASAANLDDSEDSGLFAGFVSFDREQGEETLEEIFARLNAADKNVVLKARLSQTPLSGVPEPSPVVDGSGDEPPSAGADPGGGVVPGDGSDFGDGDFFPPDGGPLPTVSTEQEVGLYVEGHQTLRVEVAESDPVTEPNE